MRDPVRTKPWLGLLGLLTFVLSSLTTAGILNLSAGRFNSTLVGLPFIVIGHGIHGMFEMLWAWRKTKEEEPVRERLSTVYADALVTYTLTTLTYLVTFGLAASPFSNLGVIKVFSRAVCLAVVFNYLYLLCFFGSCLVFSGYLERKAYHGLYCVKVVPSIHEGEDTEAPPSGWCYPTLRFYHHHDNNRHTPGASTSDVHNFHVLVWFLREFVAKWVTNTYVRPFMVLLYLIYVSFAMMGCLQTELPCDLSVLLPVKSQTLRYRAVHQTFFGSLTPIIGLYVYEPLAYWNASVRAEIGDITGGFVRLSWLEEFTLFLDHHNDSVNVSKEHFLRSLLGPFLHAPDYARFADDLVLNHSARPSPEIKASRIFLAARTTNRSNASSLQALLETLRLLSVSTDLHFIAYSPSFIFVDRCAASLSGALAIPCVSFVFLLVLSALVVVEPLGNAWVIVCVASVEFGTIGYLTLWGVDLDYVSVLCLNFALSYAAGHCSTIAFAFVSGRELTRTRWTQLALELQGAPVVQSLLCFTIAVLPLALVPSNLTYTMFRCYLAAGLSTILHVLVILPVMLTFFPPSKKARQQKKRCEQHEEIECVELHCENRVMADQVLRFFEEQNARLRWINQT
uniref:Patched domain containing 1 n=1 Tax=Eptatretus burgeri TaxID=7764 RepID=A0A8C4NDY1_EPTBU